LLTFSTTSGDSADFTPEPIDDSDIRFLLNLLFSAPADCEVAA